MTPEEKKRVEDDPMDKWANAAWADLESRTQHIGLDHKIREAFKMGFLLGWKSCATGVGRNE